jgi:hypothetical protein
LIAIQIKTSAEGILSGKIKKMKCQSMLEMREAIFQTCIVFVVIRRVLCDPFFGHSEHKEPQSYTVKIQAFFKQILYV